MLAESENQAEAEREWLFEAEKMVDTFRETRNLFLTSRVCARVDYVPDVL
jgi:general transcription factor 3C polypeptide 3 (transcription factor C subunit 4)